jgi:hypothetical protein
MPTFKNGDYVIVLDDEQLLEMYGADKMFAGKTCKIISPDVIDGYTGFHLEYISPRGFQYNCFIRVDHMAPAAGLGTATKKASWEIAADAFQKKLWEEKLGLRKDPEDEWDDKTPVL